MNKRVMLLLALLLLPLLSACNGPQESVLTAADAWVRAAEVMDMPDASMNMDENNGNDMAAEESMNGDENSMDMESSDDSDMATHDGAVSAAYLVLENSGGAADRLVSVESDAAGVIEIHTVTVDDNDVMQMRPLPDGLEVPAGGSVTLQPGGYHIMMMDLQHSLTAGETISLTLNFESGKTLTVEAEVRTP